jgi:membrane associated rhomboid family serine protease
MNEDDAARAVKLARQILETLKACQLGDSIPWIALAFICGGFAVLGGSGGGGAGTFMSWTGAILGSATLILVAGLLARREYEKGRGDQTRLRRNAVDRSLETVPAELLEPPTR